MQFFLDPDQLGDLFFLDRRHRDARPPRHHVFDVLLGHHAGRRVVQVVFIAQLTQIFALFALFVAVETRFFELVIGDRGLHPVHHELDPLLDVGDLRRQSGLPQFDPRACFIDQVDRLVRQAAVGNEPRRGIDSRLDRFVGVGHRVELLVALLDAEKDFDGITFRRRGHLYGLESPLERPVLLDRLPELARCRRPDALNLAPRQRRLQDIGRIQRPFRRTRADQSMQLVDEDDGVLIVHQLLHDRLQALFKLPAVFRAGHDQRQIQSQNPLVGQKTGHVAVGDLLGESFDDGRLAHARFADQHRIVLRSPAQNLDETLQFVIAADEGIQRSIRGRLGQIAAEFAQQRRLLRLRRGRPLGGGARDLLAHRRQAQTAVMQNLGREAFLLPEHAKQEVLGPDVLVAQPFGFFGRKGENPLAFVTQGQIHARGNLLPDRRLRLDLLANRFDVGLAAEKPVSQSLVFPQQTQQQVLRLNVRAAKLAGLVPREEDDPAGLFGVAFEHSVCASRRVRCADRARKP